MVLQHGDCPLWKRSSSLTDTIALLAFVREEWDYEESPFAGPVEVDGTGFGGKE